MSTNYEFTTKSNPCPTCQHDPQETFHIGKSSGGWKFIFHTYDWIKDVQDWRNALRMGTITDEYNRIVTYDDFWKMVEEKQSNLNNLSHTREMLNEYGTTDDYMDPDGYEFSPGQWS